MSNITVTGCTDNVVVGDNAVLTIGASPAEDHCPPLLTDEDLVKLTKKFEEEHKECVRVLPYKKECGQVEVCLYVHSGKSGILRDLKEEAEQVFPDQQVDVQCLDLYNKGSRVLKARNLTYALGKPGRLEGDEIDKISEIISKNLHVFSKYRNVTAVQPSLKVTESKQTSESCIAVYVLGKGRIPIGESEIPQSVGGYPVDVVDGFWYQTAGELWEPKNAQKPFIYLRLGASIGVKGEKASGTLGAILKDDNTGVFYLLTNDHVLNGGRKQQIIHPGLNDYQNVALWHLRSYMQKVNTETPGPRAAEIDGLLADLTDLGDLDEFDDFQTQLKRKFDVIKEIEKEHIKLIEDDETKPDEITFQGEDAEKTEKYKYRFRYFFPFDHQVRRNRINAWRNRRLPDLQRFKQDFLYCLRNPPRDVATFRKGIRDNVQFHGKKYYVDAAVAELSQAEEDELKARGTIELVATDYLPNGNCTPSTTDERKKAREFCKSGRTTGFTTTTDLLLSQDDAPMFLRDEEKKNSRCRIRDNGLHDFVNSSRDQQSRANEPETPPEESEKDEPSDPGRGWLLNCLCLPHEEETAFSTYGDSGAVVFEKCEGKRLSGFGVLFGVFVSGYKRCALASPLEIVLKKLSQEVSDTCSLKLVSDFKEKSPPKN